MAKKIYWRGRTGKKYYREEKDPHAKVIKGLKKKQCIICKEILPINCFYQNNKSLDGLSSYCKCCFWFERYVPNREKYRKEYEEFKKRKLEELCRKDNK